MKNRITPEYETLFQQHFRPAVLYAERLVGSVPEAEDLVQEVFITLLDVDFSKIDRLESYLYRCVHNAAMDQLRRRMKSGRCDTSTAELMQLPSDEHSLAEEQLYIEQIGALYRRIEALPEQGRRIFRMICIEQKSYGETARLLSVSLHTIKTHMARSYKTLRKISLFLGAIF